MEALAEQRLRMLRSFRAAADQLLNALLAYMLQGLHGPSLDPAALNVQVRSQDFACYLFLVRRKPYRQQPQLLYQHSFFKPLHGSVQCGE